MKSWQVCLAVLGAFVLLLLLAVWGLEKTVGRVQTEQPLSSRSVGELLPGSSVGQTFVAEHSGLAAVEVMLATYARENTGPVVFGLGTSPDDPGDGVTITFDAEEVVDNVYHSFDLPAPLPDSTGQRFYFYLQAPEAEPGDAITVWGATEDVYPDGEAVLEGVPGRGVVDLRFRLIYRPRFTEQVDIFLDRLVANKPSVFGDRMVYVLLAVIYLALLGALFVTASRLSPGDGAQVGESVEGQVAGRHDER